MKSAFNSIQFASISSQPAADLPAPPFDPTNAADFSPELERHRDYPSPALDRRGFLARLAVGAVALTTVPAWGLRAETIRAGGLKIAELPTGAAPTPVAMPHFPSRMQAYVWRNWGLVPPGRLAQVVGAKPSDIKRLGQEMGLSSPPRITPQQQRRSALTVIKRNWHLLPYAQLLDLLGWTVEEMDYALREDDFLYVKLGNLKPQCQPLRYAPPTAAESARAREIAALLQRELPPLAGLKEEPLFDFVRQLSRPLPAASKPKPSAFNPRFCYSYFALYGDPLLDPSLDPYPDGYLDRLAESGVNGVWLQAVLGRLSPFPWDAQVSAQWEKRLDNLHRLAARIKRRGLGLWLYLNEPRSMPGRFFQTHPDLKGVTEGGYSALCTSLPEVREYLGKSVASVCRAAPDLAGFFTITGSENLTHCWSHHQGAGCPRCGQRPPAEVVAEVNTVFMDGIRQGGAGQQLIAWDWGWADGWVGDIINRLPREALFMTVSEWGMPIQRGGVPVTIGEYSLSTIGPGERAKRNWQAAQKRGLRTMAKVQSANTWELSSVPYIPAVANAARHAARLSEAGVNGLMLGWTLGGYPSPNLEVVAEVGATVAGGGMADPDAALARVAERRYGAELAPAVVRAWQAYSAAFAEFPFDGGVVYQAPLQLGPANLLWGDPSGYHATMVGFPYDDLNSWRSAYPPEVFAKQLEQVAAGFETALMELKTAVTPLTSRLSSFHHQAIASELRVDEAAAIHFRSVANQVRFVLARERLRGASKREEAQAAGRELESILRAEMALAKRLHGLQIQDSRLGFEASNQYFYVPQDLAEKVLNCQDLLTRWLPGQLAKF